MYQDNTRYLGDDRRTLFVHVGVPPSRFQDWQLDLPCRYCAGHGMGANGEDTYLFKTFPVQPPEMSARCRIMHVAYRPSLSVSCVHWFERHLIITSFQASRSLGMLMTH
jgi:hypothetical protein